MAKASSPIRLQADLMQAATVTGKRQHRSASEQIEYWADLGRRLATIVNHDDFLSVASGLARIKIEPVYGKLINPEKIFDTLENDRSSGSLYQIISSAPHYQISENHAGYLERINSDGEKTTGRFENGEFILLNKRTS